jgi:anti-sigma factor RsiW
MLNQNEIELLSAYLDNELIGDELARVKSQLDASMEWREELESLQQTKQLSMSIPRMAAPVDLLDFLEDQALKVASRKQFSLWKIFSWPSQVSPWTWAPTMAIAALAVVGVRIHHVHQNAFLPLDPFLTAHARSGTESLGQPNVLAAAYYSLKRDAYENK